MRWPWVRRNGLADLEADFRLVSDAFEAERRERRQLEIEVGHLRRRLDAYDAMVYQRERDEDTEKATLTVAIGSGKVVALAAWRSSKMAASS